MGVAECCDYQTLQDLDKIKLLVVQTDDDVYQFPLMIWVL